jgi:hypothetical protein
VELKSFDRFCFKKGKWRGGTWLREGKSRGQTVLHFTQRR